MINAREKIKLVVADVEGCLTLGKGKSFDLESLAKIRAFFNEAKKGEKPPLVLCTGRPQPYAEAIIQNLSAFFPNFPSVIENGCFLYDSVGDVIIPNPAIEGKEKKLREIKDFLLERLNGRAKLEPGKEVCVSLNPLEKIATEELEKEIRDMLPPEYHKLIFITHSSSAVDITPRGVDKGRGVKFLSKRTGISPDHMLGIGDSPGDLPMLEAVGQVACPANSSQEVKDYVNGRGGYTAKKSFAAGVLEILSFYRLTQYTKKLDKFAKI